MKTVCDICCGVRWVCENHPDQAWDPNGCECGAGDPCPKCNINVRGILPFDIGDYIKPERKLH